MGKLSDSKTERLLKKHGIPFAGHVLAKTPEKAAQAAEKLGYPVVLKVSSADVLHKTETGGVATDIRNGKEVKRAFEKITKSVKKKVPRAKIDGILVQHMHPGREVIVGARRDPQFGPVLMFGLGGIFVEVMKDVSFRLLPVKRKDVRAMIREIKGFPVLKGVRGKKPVAFRKLEDCMLGVARMVWQNPGIKEMDINPLMVSPEKAVAVDTRILNT